MYAIGPVIASRFSEKIGEEYMVVIHIQQAALFSRQHIVDEDRYLVKEFLDKMIGILKEEKGVFKQFKIRWIDCII